MQKYGLFPTPPNFFANIFSRKIRLSCNFWILFLCLQEVKARIYFFFFCPRIANLLSLFYTGKGFFLFFCFSAVGHGFSLLIIEEKRGWKRKGEEEKRKKEERRGGWRRQGEAEEDRRARSSPTSFIFSQTIQIHHLLGFAATSHRTSSCQTT